MFWQDAAKDDRSMKGGAFGFRKREELEGVV